METKKISKWDAAPESICMMLSSINGLCDGLTSEGFSCEEADELERLLVSGLEDVLDDYNKLETKHQLDCGLISDYAEENARLKQKNEKASNNIRDLRWVLEENDIATYLNPVTVSWGVANIALQKKTEHFNTQLDNLREKLKEMEKKLKEMERSRNNWRAHYVDMSDICSRDEDDSEMLQAILRKDGYTIEYDGDIDDETVRCQDSFDLCKETTQDEVLYQYGRWTLRRPLKFSEAKANADAAILRKQCDRHIDLLDKLRWALEDKGIHCEWNEAALKWNLRDTANICESWSCKQHYSGRYPWGSRKNPLEEELRIRRKEIDDKNKLIEDLRHENEELETELKEKKNVIDEVEGHLKTLQDELEEQRRLYEKLEEKLKSAEARCKMYRISYIQAADSMRALQEFLKKCGVPVKYRNDDNAWYWDFFNKAWDDTLMKDCKLIDKCRKLEADNKDLKKKLNTIYGYRDTDNPCAICKNFDPKE